MKPRFLDLTGRERRLVTAGVMVGIFLGAMESTVVATAMPTIVAPLLIAVQNTVPRDQLGVATSVTMFSRTVGGAIGVGLLGGVMTWILRGQLLSLLAQTTDVQLRTVLQNPEVLLKPAVRAALPPSLVTGLREAVANALHGAFLVGFIIALLALISVFLLPEGFARDHVLSDGAAVSRGEGS